MCIGRYFGEHYPNKVSETISFQFYKNGIKSRHGKVLEPTKAAEYLTLNEA